jgi:hypothetical protein
MTSSLDLVRNLKRAAARLKTAAIWNGTGLAVDAKRDDYLYELLCYFRAAGATKSGFRLQIAGAIATAPNGRPAAKWPKKPGKKANFSYISLLDGESGSHEQFQLCPGVKVTDIHGKARAPDILLLSAGAPADPSSSHVVGIWDAKYTASKDSRVPDVAIADFVYTFQQLGSPTLPPTWMGVVRQKEWMRSGVLTNGKESTELTAALMASGISETCEYPSAAASTRP